MAEPLVLLNQENEGISILTLNRPDKRNALSIDLMAALTEAVVSVQNQPSQRVIVLQGAGPVFCSGLDLEEARDEHLAFHSSEMVQKMLHTVAGTPLVTIAAVHGAAVAGGSGLMSTCDFAIAAQGVRIGYPEVRRGLVAGLVMTFLQRQLKERHVRELLLLGEFIDAHRAWEMGLINRVVPSDHVMQEAMLMAETVIKGAPSALAHTKHLLNHLGFAPIEQDLQRALRHHLQARNSDEAKEGIEAFMAKREPGWAAK